MKKKEIMRYSRKIIFVSVFLILSTIFVFIPNSRELSSSLSYLVRLDSVNIIGDDNNLGLYYNYPVSDDVSLKIPSYDFVIENSSNFESYYNIVLSSGTGSNNLDNNMIKYSLYRNNIEVLSKAILNDDGIIFNDKLEKGKINYSLKFWIRNDIDNDLSSKEFEPVLYVDVIK